MSCTHHSIIIAAHPYFALQPPSPHIRNQQLSHKCHAPPHKASTTCSCPSSKPSLPTRALLCHGLGASCGERCLHMLSLITAHQSNSSRETGLVPLKKPSGASLVRHKEPWVCWKNIKPNDWLNAIQELSFLMLSSATHNTPNTMPSYAYFTVLTIIIVALN